jgi:transcriptional regulator with XRE-family HTH domain
MQIGQAIRSLREDKGWSQEMLALEAGMATSHLSRIERGERRLPTSRLDSLAAALGTSSATVYALAEGLQPPRASPSEGGDLTLDHSAEAIALRKVFRKLPLPSRRLVVDFAQMLARRS